MKTIHKFELDPVDNSVKMPAEAKILRVDVQAQGYPEGTLLERVYVWAIVSTEAMREKRNLVIAGTGHPLPNDINEYTYHGTFFVNDAKYVFHVFEDQR
jgi:hypothetical protein